jgi:hypothetical protein
MEIDQTHNVLCSVCQSRLDVHDVVIVAQELLPAWALWTEPPSIAICHEGCELDAGRADLNWRREMPQTLCHVLAKASGSARST